MGDVVGIGGDANVARFVGKGFWSSGADTVNFLKAELGGRVVCVDNVCVDFDVTDVEAFF